MVLKSGRSKSFNIKKHIKQIGSLWLLPTHQNRCVDISRYKTVTHILFYFILLVTDTLPILHLPLTYYIRNNMLKLFNNYTFSWSKVSVFRLMTFAMDVFVYWCVF